jgi:hypothetical protein
MHQPDPHTAHPGMSYFGYQSLCENQSDRLISMSVSPWESVNTASPCASL